jgi:UDP-N-acetylglucosamine transferase subunit ALG13
MIDIAAFTNRILPKLLLVASNGGHLEQIVRLAAAGQISADSVFVTFDSPQARFLIDGRPHCFVPEVGQRDLMGVVRAIPTFSRLLSDSSFAGVVSTGAALAIPAFLSARFLGLPTLYVESVSRVDGPSLTGKILSRSRLATHLRCQHPGWQTSRWRHEGSVLESYVAKEKESVGYRSAFITLGTLKKYSFPAMVKSVLATGAANELTVWQTGSTVYDNLPGRVFDYMGTIEFDRLALNSDVVVSHAGVGSVLRLLSLGVFPILIVRRSSRGEQIDDHQEQIARLIEVNGLGLVREVDDLTYADFEKASKMKVVPLNESPMS